MEDDESEAQPDAMAVDDEPVARLDWEASDVWCTGGNAHGQCGVGTSDARLRFTRVKARRGWSAVAVGDSHTVLLATDGGLFTCGLDDRGQAGLGAAGEECWSTPRKVESLEAACKAAAAGFEHSAVVTRSGEVFCFGGNDSGQCGAGDVPCVRQPRLVRLPRGGAGASCIASVACGSRHTLAVTTRGALFAWGSNAAGQCGTGDTTDRGTATPVTWLCGVVITCIAAGDAHSCAVSASGDGYAWGRAAGGVLGMTSSDAESETHQQGVPRATRPAPAAVVAALCDMGIPQADAERAAAATNNVEAAVEYALHRAAALAHQQPQARPAGMTRGAQLTPRRLTAAVGCEGDQLPPVANVACGSRHTVWTTHSGVAFTCGVGASGALGHGGTGDEALPRLVTRLQGVQSAAAGSAHTLFLCLGGALFACGSGEDGALGLADGRDKALPVPCDTLPCPARAVAAGGSTSSAWCPTGEAPPDGAPQPSPLDSAWRALDNAAGAAAHAQGVRGVCAAVEECFGTVAGAAATFMCRPVPQPCGPALDAQLLEASVVRVLQVAKTTPDVIAALREATAHLVEDLAACWSVQPDACEAAAAACVALMSPLLSQPGIAGGLYRRLCPLLAGLPPGRALALLRATWAATPCALRASRMVRPLQGFITSELAAARSTTSAVVASIHVLALLHAANAESSDPMSAEEFYSEFISSNANLVEDFGLWVHSRAEFTFCGHSFVLNPAAKAKLLRLEAALRMQATVTAARQAALFSLPPESPRWLRFLAGEVGNPFVASQEEERQHQEQEAGRQAVRHLARQPSLGAGPPPGQCGVPGTSPDWCILRVRRRCLVQDALEEVARQSQNDLFKPLRVHFIGEDGVDAGGLKKELFLLLMDELMAPANGLFTLVANGRLRWLVPDNAAPGTPEDEALQHRWRLVGTLLALAIYNGVILDLHLPRAFYKKLLGVPVDLGDYGELEPEVVQSLRKLLAWTGPGSVQDIFCLSFTVSAHVGDRRVVTPLGEAGGEDVPVTEANRQAYCDLYVAHVLTRSCARAFDALRAQFLQLCGGHALRLLSPAELEVLVSGEQHLDFRGLEAGARYSGGWDASHPTVRAFWTVVHTHLDLEDQKLLLRFITGSDRAPIGGLAAVSVLITREGPDSFRLPVSHTCFSQLMLPEYGSRGKLHERLITAIQNSAGFGIV